jgi:signal recognition particle receptor subunit beta
MYACLFPRCVCKSHITIFVTASSLSLICKSIATSDEIKVDEQQFVHLFPVPGQRVVELLLLLLLLLVGWLVVIVVVVVVEPRRQTEHCNAAANLHFSHGGGATDESSAIYCSVTRVY